MQLGLFQAALACGSTSIPAPPVFLLIDRDRISLSEEDLAELGGLGFRGSAEKIRSALDRRRRELDSIAAQA